MRERFHFSRRPTRRGLWHGVRGRPLWDACPGWPCAERGSQRHSALLQGEERLSSIPPFPREGEIGTLEEKG
jgi:hypothetical protein